MSMVSLHWLGSKLMAGKDSRGQSLVMGTWEELDPPWMGLKPSDLLLLSVASCSSWDVVSILTKQREPLEGLETTCTGEQRPDPPNVFTSVHLHFRVEGAVSPQKLERAIQLSVEKYCSVVNSLDPSIPVTTDYEIIE
ncbi:MAG TPA: OsmC family protein [Anaerolineae bacterium]|nr:OsmC family protein [Anaerolineae bacterium]